MLNVSLKVYGGMFCIQLGPESVLGKEYCLNLPFRVNWGGSAELIMQGFWGNVILSTRSVKFIGEGILSELAI